MNTNLRFALLVAALACTAGAQAQLKVGGAAGAPNSGAILDASNSSATSTTYKGIYLPQVALTSNAVYGLNTAGSAAAVDGMMVYNTATAGTGTTAVTPGIYIWNSSIWNKVNTSSVTANEKNLYEGNGTLTGARTVMMGANTFDFTGSNRVGITNTAAGNYALDVTGALTTDQAMLRVSGASGTPALNQSALIGFNPNKSQGSYPVAIGARYVNSTTGEGAADFIVGTSSGGGLTTRMIVQNNGNVGIGVTTTDAKLDVNGTARVRTVNTATTPTTVTPVGVDANGNLVKGYFAYGVTAVFDVSGSVVNTTQVNSYNTTIVSPNNTTIPVVFTNTAASTNYMVDISLVGDATNLNTPYISNKTVNGFNINFKENSSYAQAISVEYMVIMR